MLNLFRRPASRAPDRRRLFREPIKASAVLRFSSRAVPCTTVDLSEGGAKLSLSAAIMLPGRFALDVPSRNLRRSARLVWRAGDQLGVEFDI